MFPAQDARLVGFGFGFRDHALFLIKDRKTGVGQNIIRRELRDALGDGDRVVEALQFLEGAREAVHGVGEVRVGFDGRAVFRDGLLVLALGEQVKRGIVVVFGGRHEIENSILRGSMEWR